MERTTITTSLNVKTISLLYLVRDNLSDLELLQYQMQTKKEYEQDILRGTVIFADQTC